MLKRRQKRENPHSLCSSSMWQYLCIFSAWPGVDGLAQKWRGIETPLFQLLLENKVMYTKANGGSWVNTEDAVFRCQLEDELNELLMKVLLWDGLSAVAIPDHVSRALDKYSPRKTEIQPYVIRCVTATTLIVPKSPKRGEIAVV